MAKWAELFRIASEGKAFTLFKIFLPQNGENMKSIIVSMVAAAGLMVAGSALATDMPEIAKKNSCTACHAIDKKVVGPAWAEVAKKYKGDAGAKAKLVPKMIKGGGGVWGAMPMPANPKLSEADAGALVDFVLGLAK